MFKKIFAVAVVWLLLSASMASATTVNIYYAGTQYQTTEIDTAGLLSREISIPQNPSDPGYSNPKVQITVTGASLAFTTKNIFLFACKDNDPIECSRLAPAAADDSYIDTELGWNQISSGGPGLPQTANLLTIANLEDTDGRSVWVGYWDQIRRDAYNFPQPYLFSNTLDAVNIHAKSPEATTALKEIIKINGYSAVPFTPSWIEKIEMVTASGYYAIGGNDNELNNLTFQTASGQTNLISQTPKEHFLFFPKTPRGTENPVSVLSITTPACGDGAAGPGETKNSCCYDTGCGLPNTYCNLQNPSDPSTGVCKNSDLIGLEVIGVDVPQLTQCTQGFPVTFTLRVNNPPSALPSELNGIFEIGGGITSTTCSGGPIYTCTIQLQPEFSCGAGSYSLGNSKVTLSLLYKDGPKAISKDISTASNVAVNYNCPCSAGFYCDAQPRICKPSVQVSATVISTNSPIRPYTTGMPIQLTVKINNPPSDMSLQSVDYFFGRLERDGSLLVNGTSGTINCAGGPETGFVYSCSIPFTIPSYNPASSYIFRQNSLALNIQYTDGQSTVSRVLNSQLTDIVIPSQTCGDGFANPDETEQNCCIDTGCFDPAYYCNTASLECSPESNITASVDIVDPTTVEDAKKAHAIELTARIANPPAGLSLDFFAHKIGNQISGYDLDCEVISSIGGIIECILSIPEQPVCNPPSCSVGPNKLELTTKFNNGPLNTRTRQFSIDFQNVNIVPVYHCGDGVQEPELGESEQNCCADFPCSALGPGYFCDYEGAQNPEGACTLIDDIRLVIDSPTAPVAFDTCEIPNDLEVKAHIDNEPAGLKMEAFSAIINGENARIVSCKQDFSVFQNRTFTCTITIPEEDKCSQGDVFQYTPNSLSLFVSFNDGTNKKTETLTAQLPDIEVTQSFRTLFDIGEALSNRVEKIVNKASSIASKIAKSAELCAKLQLIGLLASMAFLGFGFAKGGNPFSKGGFDVAEAKEGIAVANSFSFALQSSISTYCQSVLSFNSIQLKILQIEGIEAQVQTCIQGYQHNLDSGACRKQESACFNNIVGCLNNLNSINAISNSIQQQAAATSQNIISSLATVNSALNYNTGTVGDSLIVYCAYPGSIGTPSDSCCRYGGQNQQGQCIEKEFSVVVNQQQQAPAPYYPQYPTYPQSSYYPPMPQQIYFPQYRCNNPAVTVSGNGLDGQFVKAGQRYKMNFLDPEGKIKPGDSVTFTFTYLCLGTNQQLDSQSFTYTVPASGCTCAGESVNTPVSPSKCGNGQCDLPDDYNTCLGECTSADIDAYCTQFTSLTQCDANVCIWDDINGICRGVESSEEPTSPLP